jgi:hypothetical protein
VRPETQFDGYAPETYVGMDYQVGWPHLTKGRHTVTFVCLGKSAASSGYTLGVDDLVLGRTGPAGWSKAKNVRPPVVPSDLPGLIAALGDSDHVVRGLAALALRDKGPAARTALSALVARLKDPEAGVRMMAANAIGAIGSEASGSVAPLSAACRVDGEVTHVLRACADALGLMGKAAEPALPILRDLAAKKPLVRWSAERAIGRIEGKAQGER